MKMGWKSARLYSLATINSRRAARLQQKPLTPPVRIETEGYTWHAVLTAPQCERRVTSELIELGFHSYCPLGRKKVHWQGGKLLKTAIVREFPVFPRYMFAGSDGRPLNRDDSDKIVSILGNSAGPIAIPSAAIAHLNALELAGQWDETGFKPTFSPGQLVHIAVGPFAGFPATVDAQESETAIRVMVSIFGRQSPATVDLNQVEMAS